MKKLHLPKSITLRLNLDRDDEPKGDPADMSGDMAVVEVNGSAILGAAILLEDRMIEAISKVLFEQSTGNKDYRDFFIGEIIGTSDFSFAFKRRVFTRLLEQFELLETASIKQLKADLNKVMLWRNAFAHGQVIHDQHDGYVLSYYSGGHQELILNDDFFAKAEETIRSCLYACNSIIQTHPGKA